MLLKIFKNRTVSSSGTWGTKNENNYEILNFEFPEELEEYNKRIVYYLGNQKVWDAIIDNKAILTNAITTKGSVKAYIRCTKSDEAFETDVDFRTQIFVMNFFENENADGIVPTEEQVDGFNTMLTAMNEKIEEINELETTIENAETQRQENEETRQENESTRQENEQIRQEQETERERRTDEAIADIEDKTAEYNANAEAKTNEFNQNATQKTNEFNNNYTQKVNDFNTNASSKTSTFNSNAETKTNTFNTNATNKTNAFNSNATEKTTTFDDNASTKTSEFNSNAESKTSAFNDNATQKTTNFDNNASEKTDEFNTNAQEKIDEYDEHIADYQAQIDELQEEVEELSENMPWNTTEQATEISVDDAAKYSRNKLELFGNTEQAENPSPDYPQPIHVVTGNNTIHVLKPGEVVLPSNYTQLDYIESTGTQYIDTGINADSNKRVVMDMQYTDISNNNNTNMFAIRSTGSGVIRFHFMTQNSKWSFFAGGSNTPVIQSGNSDTNRHLLEFDVKNRKAVVDNITRNFTVNDFDVQANIYLFARNGINTARYYNKSKVYKCSIYDNNILVRNFIPCKNPNNEIGLYDTVSKSFFANQGTGNFVAGNEVLHPTYPVNLGNIELYKIGDYQDYLYKENGNWYKNEEITMLTSNDLKNINWNKVDTTDEYSYFYTRGKDTLIKSGVYNGYCNIMNVLKSPMSVSTIVTTDTINFGDNNNDKIRLKIKTNRLTEDTQVGLKTWFDSVSLKCYVILAVPTSTQITDETLIAQLDAIYEHLKLVKGTNNITVTASDLAPYMELSYMQDIKSKLDNLDSRLALLE